MWPFSKRSARRQEIRRSKAERLGFWHRRLAGALGPGWLSITVLTAVAVCFILNAGADQLDYRAGQHVPRAVAARVAFELADPQQTRDMRVRARDASPNYYKLDVSLLDDIQGRLVNALTLARAHKDDPEMLRQQAANNKVMLDDAGVSELLRLAALPEGGEFTNYVETLIRVLRQKWLVESETAGLRRTATKAVLVEPDGQQRQVNVGQLVFTTNVEAAGKLIEEAARVFREPLAPSIQASVAAILGLDNPDQPDRPLYRYDNERTQAAAEEAGDKVPVQMLKYAVGDALADAGGLSADEIVRLKAEQQSWLAQTTPEQLTASRLTVASRCLLALLVVFGVTAYMARHQQRALRNPLHRATSALVLLIIFGLTRFVFVTSEVPPHIAVGSQALAAAVFSIVYAPGAVFAICGGLAVLMTLAVEQGVPFFIILLAVSGTFIFSLRQVRNRGTIVLVGSIAACVALATSLAAALIDGQVLSYAVMLACWAAGGTLLAAFVVEGILPGIERIFRLSTAMTLLEWCDASKPLLRMMAADAPGTYNHSLLVGALAEAACESVGANGLLARAGAYYHDIGKINKPEYFIENQSAGASRHDRLSPAMSLLIIIGHVKDGIEMAKEYGLPVSLHRFIAEHHGTTLVEYFYHAANRQRKPDEREVPETEFRYPGPKPQSRETAVVMLCDAVEGAVRAMSEPTPGRIEQVVGDILRKRLLDGQFDECELTFRELALIEKSLIKALNGIYHARIVYPESEADERRQTARSAS